MGSSARGNAAIGGVLLFLAGCVIIPVPSSPVLDIPPEQRAALRSGETTRAEILLRFGEPDLRLDEDRVLVYRWNRVQAIVWLAIGYGGELADVEAIFLAFDDSGRLARVGGAVAWKKAAIAEQAAAWAKGDGAGPAPRPP